MTPYLLRDSALDLESRERDPTLLWEPVLIGLVSPARQFTANLNSSHISCRRDSFSSTASFLRFHANSKRAMIIETPMPPTRTINTPPSWPKLSCAFAEPAFILQLPPSPSPSSSSTTTAAHSS